MKLFLVRHAESKRNTHEKSSVDAELTDIGKEQARRCGSYFSTIELTKVYCSPLKRARATFKPIHRQITCKNISYTKDIAEINLGEFGDGSIDNLSGFFKAAVNSGIPYHTFRPKKGESLQDTYDRASKFYQKLLKNHSSKDTILIVGHGFFNLYLMLYALGLDLFEGKYYKLSNASISTLYINAKGKVTKYTINDYNHLIAEGIKKAHAPSKTFK